MPTISFKAILEQDKDGTWWYVHVPKHVRESFKHVETRSIINVTVTIRNSTWAGSMLPWADGSAQISVNKKIRDKEGLGLHDNVAVSLQPR